MHKRILYALQILFKIFYMKGIFKFVSFTILLYTNQLHIIIFQPALKHLIVRKDEILHVVF